MKVCIDLAVQCEAQNETPEGQACTQLSKIVSHAQLCSSNYIIYLVFNYYNLIKPLL